MENLSKLEQLLTDMQNMMSQHHQTIISHEIIIKLLTDILEEAQILTTKEIEDKFKIRMNDFVEALAKQAEEQRAQEKEFKNSIHQLLASMRPEGNA